MWRNKQEQETIFKELQDIHSQANEHLDNLNRENIKGISLDNKVNQLQDYISDQKDAHEEAMHRFKGKFDEYQKEINSREDELAGLRARLHNKAEELKIAEIGMITNHTKALDTFKELESKSSIAENLQKELARVKQELAEVQVTRKSEGKAILEIEHLRADNDRLVKLLKKTKEYKSFSGFAEDNLGSVRYMPASKNKK